MICLVICQKHFLKEYYCFLVPSSLPILVVAIQFHWFRMKIFKHTQVSRDGFVDGPFGQFIRKIKTILVTKLIKTLGDLWCLLRSPRSGSCWKVFTGLLVLVLVIFYFAGRVFRVGGDL
ncbi:uncharacterized protein [Nicotiana sylvestris]|uniref:Uncharacterized protein LOC104249807 n=1 Tax=Nicotiana sylvestris TaxID=4096 RepID=A0A1U7YKJ6_NICSY|nr:PREDICTED: uncharacterized protein LOC104249807 [Nicotiana sylvestris]XP_009804603.1 PREDICTED: uncharacterized protein LOC104249807 [Nicotiana sylvestris]